MKVYLMIDKIQRGLMNDILQNRENLIVDIMLTLQNASSLVEVRSIVKSFIKDSNVRRDTLTRCAKLQEESYLPKSYDVWSNLNSNQFTMTLSKDANQRIFPYGFPLFVATVEAMNKPEAFEKFNKSRHKAKVKDIGFSWNEAIQNNLG